MNTTDIKNNQDILNLFTPKFGNRLFCIARSEYNWSSYGHGKHDDQSAEYAVAQAIINNGQHTDAEAQEIATDITSRVIAMIEEEQAAIENETYGRRMASF